MQWLLIGGAILLLAWPAIQNSGGKLVEKLRNIKPSPAHNDHGPLDDLKCLLKHFEGDEAALKAIKETVLPLVLKKELEV